MTNVILIAGHFAVGDHRDQPVAGGESSGFCCTTSSPFWTAFFRLPAQFPADIPSNLRTVQEVQKKLERLRQQNERLVPQKAEADKHLSKTICRSLIL